MVSVRDKAHASRYAQDAINPVLAAKNPAGAVAEGRARKPPPIVVPAIKAACDNMLDLSFVEGTTR